jgi:O-antigen/teichoic acid export membrane protein
MITKSYTKNYLKIYFWQGISLVLNFFSMFIVIPYLTSDPNIYGIYTVCLSISIFLSYADLGFLSAGQKYAAEYYIREEKKEELKVIGFTSLILLVFLVILSVLFTYLSFNPTLVVKDLVSGTGSSVASSLLLILALFTPITLLQRIAQMIFSIRIEDFIVQRSNIVASILKIVSVLWFFRKGNYDIVGYFLFTQIVNLIAILVTLVIARLRYNYDFKALFYNFRFDVEVYNKIKKVAFTSLFVTISWILYYELDPLVISKVLGANQVAIYAIGLTVLSFFRSILGIMFSPFNARFNYFVGNKDEDGLKSFFLQIVTTFAPFVVLPIVALTVLSKPLILSWVGRDYIESVLITQFLMCCNLFAFITYPAGILLLAQERVKDLFKINLLIPVVYWLGIAGMFSLLGLKSFAVFKLIAFFISASFYYLLIFRYLNVSLSKMFSLIFMPLFLPVAFLIFSGLIAVDYLPIDKSKLNLLIVAVATGALILMSFVVLYLFSDKWRGDFSKIVSNLK